MEASDIELDKLGPAAQKVLSEAAPLPAQLMAAKGVIPGAKPNEIVIVIAELSRRWPSSRPRSWPER